MIQNVRKPGSESGFMGLTDTWFLSGEKRDKYISYRKKILKND
jgi:hypothetical protein